MADLDPAAARAIIEASPEAFAAIDAEHRVVVWNAAAARLTGFAQADALGGPLPHLTDAQVGRIDDFLATFADHQVDVPVVVHCMHASGRVMRICVTGHVALQDATGAMIGHGSFFRAVRPSDAPADARNAYSRALAAATRTADAMAALATVIGELLPGDRGYLMRRSDDGWTAWLAAGDHRDIVDGIEPVTPAHLDEVVDDGRCRSTSVRILGQAADVVAVPAGPASEETLLLLIPGPTDAVDEAVHALARAIAAEAWATLRRIDALDELDERIEGLEAQRRAAEEFRTLDQQRGDYVAGITHDLRSPVTAILGFARTLSQAGDLLTAEEQREALDTIERQSLRINRMLGDMLDSARAESGLLVPDLSTAVPLHGAVREAVMTSGPDHLARVDMRLDTELTVCGDADQLIRVVQNLVVNALQYAPADTPVVVIVEGEEDQAVLRVIDAGPGIPSGLDVFTRFGRGDSGGTGLGLYTVRQIVELHGGTIELTTTPGGGTTVTVHLPRHDPPAEC